MKWADQPIVGVQLTAADEVRFWSKVDKTDACWLWKGALRGGYGRFRAGGVLYTAHRLAWELVEGPLAPEVVLDHGEACSNRRCVRPAHLQVVPLAVNTIRSNVARAWACNHPRIPLNITKGRDGAEMCLICKTTRRRMKRKGGRQTDPGSTSQR